MRTSFFSHQSTGQVAPSREQVARPPDPDRAGVDEQQALLLSVLHRAGAAPVSYSELKDAGVEFPASVVSELELAGVAIERCSGRGPRSRRQVGVRLAPAADPDPGTVAAAASSGPIADVPRRSGWAPVRVYRAGVIRTLLEGALACVLMPLESARGWTRRTAAGRPAIGGRMLAPLALMVAAGVAAAVALSVPSGRGGARARYHSPAIARQVIAARPPDRTITSRTARTGMPSTSRGSTSTTTTTTTLTTATSTPAPSAATPSTPGAQPSPAPASSTLPSSAPATDLEARGHELMVAGQYDQAVPILRRALAATGQQPGACAAPTTQTCLTYAYALYDLGRSLRLAGHPAAAVPILKRRLRIDNQRPIVASELGRARKQARRNG